MADAEEKVETLKTNRALAKQRLEELKRKYRDLLSHEVVYSELLNAKDLVTRAKLREEIRRKAAKIEAYFAGNSGKFLGVVTFTNGVRRNIAFTQGMIYAIQASELLADFGVVPTRA
jgi:hypothetical protein